MTKAEYFSDLRLGRVRLWCEFLALFVAAPLVMAVFVPPNQMFPMLFGLTAVGVVLLIFTKGFEFRELIRGWSRINWRFVGIFSVLTAAACFMVMWILEPEFLFGLLKRRPHVLAMIFLLYPILSVIPQELVYRPLFFKRYGALFPNVHVAVGINAVLFSLAHLMYWNIVVAVMTFLGGVVFAHSYAIARNFPQCFLLHAIAGNMIFLFGLGIYFYSGNVVRPF